VIKKNVSRPNIQKLILWALSYVHVITVCLAKFYVYRRPWASGSYYFQSCIGQFT